MAGISSKALGNTPSNKYKFNGKEEQRQEFSDGSGLEEYDFGARQDDPQIGRFTTVDPFAEKNRRWSPYSFCKDDPLNRVDPDGMDDYSMVDGKVSRVGGKTKDKNDRIIQTDKNGKPKLKGQGFLGFTVKQSERGTFKTAIGGVEKGILQGGQNFKTTGAVISVGTGQASVAGVKSFALKLSEYLGVEIKGFSYSADGSGKETDILVGGYAGNDLTHSSASVQGLDRKYGVDFSLNNIVEQFHTHPNGTLGATDTDPKLSTDVSNLKQERKDYPNAKFTVLYRGADPEKPEEFNYTNQ